MNKKKHPENRNESKISQLHNSTIEGLLLSNMSAIHRLAKQKGLLYRVDDLIQDTFLTLMEESRKKQIEDPRSYLFGILRIKIIKYCEERRQITDLFQNQASLKLCEEVIKDDFDLVIEQQELINEKIQKLKKDFDRFLTPYQKKVMSLKYFDSKSYKEISTTLGKKESAIRKVVSNSEIILRKIYNISKS